ncbi:WXG100 family type VII secretion target [Kitasatospora azatica]|uniref:WXG100 family type VII secretion target n=1 Tax=Kitasatospora azatica TaxID=58347 RepID=UPI00055C8BFC|nr:hypothetical protein [Kitasatospora azatica]
MADDPPFSTKGDGPKGAVGMYDSYSYEQVIGAIQGGFSNDPDYSPVDPNTIIRAGQEFGVAADALVYAGKTLSAQLTTLLGTKDHPLWTGDAADEFAAIGYGILTWLADTVKRIGHEYNVLMGCSGTQLYQAQLALNKLGYDAIQAYDTAQQAANDNSDPYPFVYP